MPMPQMEYEQGTLYVVMYFVSLSFLLLTVYNTRLTIEMNCILNHTVKYFPSFVGKLILV